MQLQRFKQTYMNGGKVLLKSAYAQATGKRIPIFATLYITDVCNQNCTHCGIHTVNQKTNEYTTEEMIEHIDKLCEMGTEWFRLLGGEPMVRQDLKQLIDHISVKRGKIAEIVTNGLMLPKRMDWLENLHFVGISLEGNRENHERVRGKGSFDKAVRAIKACIEAGKYVRLHMVLNKYNMQEDNVNFMIDFCRENQIQFDFCRLMINPYFQEQDIPDYYFIPDDEAMDFYRYILERKKKEHIPISNSTHSLEKLLAWPVPHEKQIMWKDQYAALGDSFKIPECACGNACFELSSDGKLRLCVNRYDEEIDVREQGGLEAAWEKMADKSCHSCSHLSVIEQSLMLSMDPVSIANAIRLLWKKRAPKRLGTTAAPTAAPPAAPPAM